MLPSSHCATHFPNPILTGISISTIVTWYCGVISFALKRLSSFSKNQIVFNDGGYLWCFDEVLTPASCCGMMISTSFQPWKISLWHKTLNYWHFRNKLLNIIIYQEKAPWVVLLNFWHNIFNGFFVSFSNVNKNSNWRSKQRIFNR